MQIKDEEHLSEISQDILKLPGSTSEIKIIGQIVDVDLNAHQLNKDFLLENRIDLAQIFGYLEQQPNKTGYCFRSASLEDTCQHIFGLIIQEQWYHSSEENAKAAIRI